MTKAPDIREIVARALIDSAWQPGAEAREGDA